MVQNTQQKGAQKGKGSYKDYRAQIQASRLARGFAPSGASASIMSSKSHQQAVHKDALDKQTWRQQRLQKIIAKSRCAKCGQIGHWARTCPNPPKGQQQHAASTNFFVHALPERCVPEAASASMTSQSRGQTSNFVVFSAPIVSDGAVMPIASSPPEEHWLQGCYMSESATDSFPQLAVLDSGAQTAVCGRNRWEELIKAYYPLGLHPELISEKATVTHGIGGIAPTSGIWRLPVGIGGISGLIDITIIEQPIPLLVPISLQRELGMVLNLPTMTATWTAMGGAKSKIITLPTGHIAISVTEWPDEGWHLPHALHDISSQLVQGVGDRSATRQAKTPHAWAASRQNLGQPPVSGTEQRDTADKHNRSGTTHQESFGTMESVSKQRTEHPSVVSQPESLQYLATSDIFAQPDSPDSAFAEPEPTVIDTNSSVHSSCATYSWHRSPRGSAPSIVGSSNSCSRASSMSSPSTGIEASREQGEKMVHMHPMRHEMGTDGSRSSSISTSRREDSSGTPSRSAIQGHSSIISGMGDRGVRESGAQHGDAWKSPAPMRVASQQTESSDSNTPRLPYSCSQRTGGSTRDNAGSCSHAIDDQGKSSIERRYVHFLDELPRDVGVGRSRESMSSPTEILHNLKKQALLTVQQLKAARSRTAVGPQVDSYPFGLYTRQGGAGITSLTFEHPDLVQAVNRAAEGLGLSYTSFVINFMLPGAHVDWHRDLANHANAVNAVIQFNVSEQDYEGGELQLMNDQGKVTNVSTERDRWVTFNPHVWHRITTVQKGARVSIVLFATGGLHRVEEALWMKLRQLKFPISGMHAEAKVLSKNGIGPLGAKWVHTVEHALIGDNMGLLVHQSLAPGVRKALQSVQSGYDGQGIQVGCHVFFELQDWTDCLMAEQNSALKTVNRQLKKAVLTQSATSTWKELDVSCWPVWTMEEREAGLDPAEDLNDDLDDFDDDAPATSENDAWNPSEQQKQDVKRLHDNLGHPGMAELVKMLHRGRAYKPLIRWTKKHFRCPTCEAQVKPALRTVAKHPATYAFNMLLGVDLFFIRSPIDGSEVIILNCSCWGTGYQSLQVLPDRTPEATWWGLSQCWMRFAGPPKVLISDSGGEFQGSFTACLGQAGVAHYQTDSRSPWQNGRTERAGAECKRLIYKTMEECVPSTQQELEALIYTVAGVRNRHNVASGFSPNQRVFGTERGIPDSLICPSQRSALVYEGPLEQMRNADLVRQSATRAWAALDNRERLLRASRAKHRKPMAQLCIGQYVYLWRQPNLGKGQWIGPGQIVALHPTGAYLSLRGSLYKAARINLRPATPEEEQADVMIRNFASSLRKTDKLGLRKFHDVTQDTSPVLAAEAETLAEYDNAVSLELERSMLDAMPSAPVVNLPLPMPEESVLPIDVNVLEGNRENVVPRDVTVLEGNSENVVPRDVSAIEDFNENSLSPDVNALEGTAENPLPIDVNALEDNPETSLPNVVHALADDLHEVPRMQLDERGERTPRRNARVTQPETAGSPNVRPWTEVADPASREAEPPWRRRRREQDEQEMAPMFRGAATLMNTPRTNSPRHFVGMQGQLQEDAPASQTVVKGIVKPEAMEPNKAKLFLEGSRLAEAKVVQPSMEPIYDENEVAKIIREIPERVITSRWLDTWKAVDEGEVPQPENHKAAGIPPGLVAKSRLILQGFTDPDYDQMECEVPTPEIGDITMMCQLLSSHRCQAYVADIKGAFNQALSGLRAESLYVLLPDSYPLWPGVRVAKLVKELYGLLPGPASWRYTLLSEAKRLGFIKHGTCPCLLCFPEYMEVDSDGRYCTSSGATQPTAATMGGWILIQTDDLLMGGNGHAFQKALEQLRQRFKFGRWDTLKGTRCTFNGRQLIQLDDFGFHYDMTTFVRKVPPIQIEKGRKKADVCVPGEVAAFRKLLGALLWAARGALPQILGDLSLLANRINALTVESLMALNKTLKRAQELSIPIRIFPIAPKRLAWITWSDASLANQEGSTTQIAFLIGVTDRDILGAGKGYTSLLHYASKKMKRVASSTLMTEACALTACLSELEWWIEWWSSANSPSYQPGTAVTDSRRREIHTPPIDRRLREETLVQGFCIVDSKSLYDVVRKAVSAGQCKKAALEALTASDTLQLRGLTVRWQPHEWNVADPLTKLHGHTEPLVKLISTGLAQLLPECQHLESRAAEREEMGYNTRAKRYSVDTLQKVQNPSV
eukprot:6492777-Amphidinium_carterae.1